MGVVRPSSEGVPGGLSADGRRRRMAGCGALGSSVSRSSPSIPRTSPVKRLRRYAAASLCSLLPFRSAEHSYMHVTQTCTAWVINAFHCESETLGSRSSCLRIDRSWKLRNWLIITDLVDCARSLKMESLSAVHFLSQVVILVFFIPDYFSVPPFLTHSRTSTNSNQSISGLQKGNSFCVVISKFHLNYTPSREINLIWSDITQPNRW